MTTSHINRRTATVLTAALALGTAGPAAAQPIGSDGPVPVAPPLVTLRQGQRAAAVCARAHEGLPGDDRGSGHRDPARRRRPSRPGGSSTWSTSSSAASSSRWAGSGARSPLPTGGGPCPRARIAA